MAQKTLQGIMITHLHRLTLAAALFASAAFLGNSASGSIIYDNSTTYLGKIHSAGNAEFGDEIFLAGTDRILSEFQFQYFTTNNSGGVLSGNETAEVFFRLNDGPLNSQGVRTPGTLFYDSTPFPLANGFRPVSITGLALQIPANSFTWSVAFRGIEANETAGLLFFNPPTVGSSFDDFWQLTGTGWQTFVVDGGATPGNFAARLTAVPEPSTYVYGLIAGVGYAGWFFRRRKA